MLRFRTQTDPPMNALRITERLRCISIHDAWETMISSTRNAIVNIHFHVVRPFDSDKEAGSFHATGFIVDTKIGLIVSNRHVVSVGPITAKAVLSNYDEMNIYPIYRDPVHDFGFFQFNPKDIPSSLHVQSIELFPEGAKVGTKIRIIGNDAGEKLSILAATISRLDREAPDYGAQAYHDFNTYYIQASISTSSIEVFKKLAGASGSPVLNILGQAIGMNSGTSQISNHSFILPLWNVQKALHCLQKGKKPQRGCLMVQWFHVPFVQARKHGFLFEASFRKLNTFGVLIAQNVSALPFKGFHQQIEKGDILLSINEKWITSYRKLEEILDAHVGQMVTLSIQRVSDVLTLKTMVIDLHSLMPKEYVEFGDTIIHSMSYHFARSFPSVPCTGVFVAYPGSIFNSLMIVLLEAAGVPRFSIITRFDNYEISDLNSFIKVCMRLKDTQGVRISFIQYTKQSEIQSTQIIVDFALFKCFHAVQSENGLWKFSELFQSSKNWVQSSHLSFESKIKPVKTESMNLLVNSETMISNVFSRMVQVSTLVPFLTEGVSKHIHVGFGFVLPQNDFRLILTDRASVPTISSKILISFKNGLQREARVVFFQNWCPIVILHWIGGQVEGVFQVPSNEEPIQSNQQVEVVFLKQDSYHPYVQSCQIESIGQIALPWTRTCQPLNLNYLEMDMDINGLGGIIMKKDYGSMIGFWLRDELGSNFGISIQSILPIFTRLYSQMSQIESKKDYRVDFDYHMISISETTVPSRWRNGKSLLMVTRAMESLLKPKDLILSIGETTIQTPQDLIPFQKLPIWTMKVWRNQQEVKILYQPYLISMHSLKQYPFIESPVLFVFAGAVIQLNTFISQVMKASPAEACGMKSGFYITKVNGETINDAMDLLKMIQLLSGLKKQEITVGLELQTKSGFKLHVCCLMDEHYWPSRLVQSVDGRLFINHVIE